MLIRLVTLYRRIASDPPEEKVVAIDPEMIVRIEEAHEPNASRVWCDGMNDKPYLVRGSVDDVLQIVQSEIDKTCEPGS